jgi:DNA polymerase I
VPTADLSGVQLHFVDSVEMAGRFLTWLSERRPDDVIAVDTETGELPGNDRKHAFSPWHGRLRLVQVGDAMTGWAIPWERWNGVFHEAMERYQGEIICHNVAFEAKWFAIQSDFRIPWHRTHDTMIASQVTNPLQSAALKSLTKRYVDGRAAGLQQMLDQKMHDGGWTWGTIPIHVKEYWSYGALDCVLTVRLWHVLKERLEPYKTVYDMEMGVRRVCTNMELRGARVDVDYSQAQYDRLGRHAQSIRDWVKDAYGINAGSPSQLTKVFVDRFGASITERTPAGSPKMDKTQLKKFTIAGAGTEMGQLAEQVLAMRKSAKLADTYFDNFIQGNLGGLMHPQIRTLGARTGRMSITDPALQTLPKGDKVVRKAFVPRNEGELMLSCDLEQVEFRMMAALCADPKLVALFEECDRTGDDAFTRIGQDVYADPGMVKADPRRAMMKTYIYGTMYGAGIATSAVNAGVPEHRMREVAGAFNQQYPGVKGFMQQIEHIGMTRQREEGEPYVLTQFGRRLPADEGRVYTLVNYLIQGGAAEVFKLDLLKADAAGLGDYMVVPVHDELVLSVPKEEARDVGKTLQECMTTRQGWAVPLLAGDPEAGLRWGDMKSVDDALKEAEMAEAA